MAWEQLVALEPRLLVLEQEALETQFSWAAYVQFARRLQAMVGWEATQAEMAKVEAFEVAIKKIYTALESTGATAVAEPE